MFLGNQKNNIRVANGILWVQIWVRTVCQVNQHTTNVTTNKEKVDGCFKETSLFQNIDGYDIDTIFKVRWNVG